METKSRLVPLKLPAALLSKFIQKATVLKTFDLRKSLSDRLSKLLLLKKNDVQEASEGGLHSKQARQLYVTSVLQTARVQGEFMPRDKHNKIHFPFNDHFLSKLNSIILGQYFIKGNMSVSTQDILEIQKNDPFLNGIRLELEKILRPKKLIPILFYIKIYFSKITWFWDSQYIGYVCLSLFVSIS